MDQRRDHELMLAVRDGDLPQMGDLFERYARRLFNFFLRLTFDREASEDLVQETFRRMLEARLSYRDDSRFLAWMFAIARSRHSDHYRRRRHCRDEVALSEHIQDQGATPDAEFERRREAQLLWKALGRLSVEKREAIVLSRFEYFKYQEIARIVGCPVGTIKGRVHQALKDLAQYFRELGYDVR